MSFFTPGTPAIASTQGLTTNPSTSSIVAEIDSTQLALVKRGGQNFQVTWIAGGSTIVTWQFEQCLSTGLDMSTAGRDLTFALTPTGQSGQYITKLRLEPGDRLRARVQTGLTAVVAAKIFAEPID